MYMTELIAITQRALQSQSWKMKAQGAAAMATIAKQQTGSLVAPHLGMVLSALLQGLAGRTWAGKVIYSLKHKLCAKGQTLYTWARTLLIRHKKHDLSGMKLISLYLWPLKYNVLYLHRKSC